MKPRHTEEVAAETLLDLTKQLQALCFGHPTTAEIEEALRLVRPIEVTLRAWISSRKLNQAHTKGAAEFRAKHPAVAEVVAQIDLPGIGTAPNPAQAEAQRIENAHVHAAFGPCLDLIQQRPA